MEAKGRVPGTSDLDTTTPPTKHPLYGTTPQKHLHHRSSRSSRASSPRRHPMALRRHTLTRGGNAIASDAPDSQSSRRELCRLLRTGSSQLSALSRADDGFPHSIPSTLRSAWRTPVHVSPPAPCIAPRTSHARSLDNTRHGYRSIRKGGK
ncbi:uncharacterized protein K452DRAFT_29789 [Aplosporella prunicola CBS 121167]|uniref:Uncharacterized protein n=1 Tax=Aplosporella prunicola CBS 121167 TaxID=1176127 RepID=A0A6A6ATI6_9PEZI|nr:uncharacterized protein K452DRAFT_29789 [Aplosporella prunicola CBS 121167]KAF2135322.1 hypothetical protein K452DRAFT_29789 [Aplosporella prunicola CBS 121167]